MLVSFLSIAAGCSNRTTPQQQYYEALMRGNSANASQIWLQMTPEDRVKFQMGRGLNPQPRQEEIAKQIQKHRQQESSEQDDSSISSPNPLQPLENQGSAGSP
jgi:hypothetical protein